MLCCEIGAVVACQAVANIVKSSLGPVGLDKVSVAVMCVFTCRLLSFSSEVQLGVAELSLV